MSHTSHPQVERLHKLRAALAAGRIDLLALIPGGSLRYLTGLSFHAGKRLSLTLIPSCDRPPVMVLPALEANSVEGKTPFPVKMETWSDAEGPLNALIQGLKKSDAVGEVTIGIEPAVMRVMELRALEAAGASYGATIRTVDAGEIIAGLRMVKSADELDKMREAVRIIETALQLTIDRIRPGITEKELARHCTEQIMEAGGEGTSFESFVGAGANSANPHHESGDRPLEAGDIIIIDCGAVYQGYASDITRTVALGEPGPELRKIYDTVLAANAAGRAAVKPGVTGEAIDAAARGVIEEAGYGPYFTHRTGHGLGMEIHPCHEAPDLVAGSVRPLGVGTTFTIEPGIYVPGLGGVRIEDDMVITQTGGESLTSFERELIVLPG